MSDEKGYNGWTNYETWNIALWLGNDQGSEEMMQEMAADCVRHSTSRSDAAGEMARMIKDLIEENAPDLGCSMYADLLGAAISSCNWYEIAEHYIDDNWEEDAEA